MNTRSITTRISAPPEAVFRFLEKPENLPTWAIEFCRSVRRNGDGYIASTKGGDAALSIRSHAGSAVVDFWVGPAPDRMGVLPARVLELPDGSALVQFLLIQGPDVDDAKFEADLRGLEKEAHHLKALLESTAA